MRPIPFLDDASRRTAIEQGESVSG